MAAKINQKCRAVYLRGAFDFSSMNVHPVPEIPVFAELARLDGSRRGTTKKKDGKPPKNRT